MGNQGAVASSKAAALAAAAEFVGPGARPIYKAGEVIGKISADGTKIYRITSISKAQPYVNLVNRATGGNLHMNAKDLETLNANVDRVVKIRSRDGETLLAKVVLVSEEDEDLIYELVSTSRESQYEKFDEQPAYAIDFKNIESVEAVAPGPPKTNPATPGPTGNVR